jgi:hypothetical protein
VCRRRALRLIPIAVALIAHGAGVAGDFVADDIPDIVDHPVVGGGESPARVLDYNYMGAPLGEGANTLRPLATLELALEWRLSGGAPWLFHLISIGWFVLLVVIAQRLLERLVSETAAIWGAALFAALAIHVDAVALTANRPEVSSLALALIALGAALDRRAAIAVVAYLAALLYKESAFLLPAIAAWWVFAIDGIDGLRWRRRGAAIAALAIAAAVFFAARAALLSVDISGFILPADNPLIGAPDGARVWTPFVLLGEYLTTAAAPVDLAFDHTYAAIPVDADLTRLSGWLGVIAVAAIVAVIAVRARRAGRSGPHLRRLAAVAGGFAGSYALFSNSVFLIVTLFAERLFLGPSFFLVAAITCAGTWAVDRIEGETTQRILAIAAAAAIAAQAGLAALRTLETLDEPSLFAAQVAAQPDSVKGRNHHARILARAGRYDEAIWHLGVASAGRRRFPGPFRAPRLEGRSIDERLATLPELLAPGEPHERFWRAFRGFAGAHLGPGAAAAVDRAALRYHPPP